MKVKQNNIEDVLVGSSSAITNIRNIILEISQSDRPVLISGEIGTGKHLVAELIISMNIERSLKLIEFNCLAIPKRLHEEILLGYIDENGDEHTGLLEGAKNSCLLIENFENLSIEAQSSLLGIILNGSYYPSGGRISKKCDIRIIASTENIIQNLTEDDIIIPKLLKEISEIQIDLPPLRERKEDIPLLVKKYVNQISEQLGKTTPVIPPELVGKYLSQEWSGNVSQLISSIRTLLFSTAGGEIDTKLILADINAESSDILSSLYQQFKKKAQPLREFKSSVEGTVIKTILKETKYNVTEASRRLGMSESGMRRAMERLGILTTRQRKGAMN